MPIARINSHLVYFAHVPKCAGTAVEKYLGDRFGPLAFLDRDFLNQPPRRRWTKTSPQHILAGAHARLFPPGFFDESFAVVRHPTQRMISLFRYQRDVLGALPKGIEFADWLDSLSELQMARPFYLDNHARPMADFLPPDTTVFRLEDGTDQVVDWLDGFAGGSDPGFAIGTRNTYAQRLKVDGLPQGPDIRLSDADHALVERLYAVDFERFCYSRGQ